MCIRPIKTCGYASNNAIRTWEIPRPVCCFLPMCVLPVSTSVVSDFASRVPATPVLCSVVNFHIDPLSSTGKLCFFSSPYSVYTSRGIEFLGVLFFLFHPADTNLVLLRRRRGCPTRTGAFEAEASNPIRAAMCRKWKNPPNIPLILKVSNCAH
jgi:hypothetical protein